MEVEIVEQTRLTAKEERLLGVHSFINILNIVTAELIILAQDDSTKPEHRRLLKALQKTKEILEVLQSGSSAPPAFSAIEELESIILDGLELNWVFNADGNQSGHFISPDPFSPSPKNYEHYYNLKKLLSVLKVRYREYLSQYSDPLRWAYHDISLFKMSFYELFRAVELNSNHRFRIVHNIAEQGSEDYLIHLDILSAEGKVIFIPLVMHDIARDLILNARKYTLPGGQIIAGLIDNGRSLRLVVQDNGIGIPEDEISKVVNFGYRGTNIGTMVRQYGGGFGLTKAYVTTKKLGGRFTIRSKVNIGTCITIEIPTPM